MADLDSQPLGIVQVLLDIPLRIDHDCAAARFVGNEVGGVGKASQVVLLQKHGDDSSRGPPPLHEIENADPLRISCFAEHSISHDVSS